MTEIERLRAIAAVVMALELPATADDDDDFCGPWEDYDKAFLNPARTAAMLDVIETAKRRHEWVSADGQPKLMALITELAEALTALENMGED